MSLPASQWPDPKPSEPIPSADGPTQEERLRAVAESARAYREVAESKKALRGRVGRLLRLDRAHRALKRLAAVTHRHVDIAFNTIDRGVSLLERVSVRVDLLLDALIPREALACRPLEPAPSDAAPVKRKRPSRKSQRGARVRCIVVTRQPSVDSDAKIDPVPPRRKKPSRKPATAEAVDRAEQDDKSIPREKPADVRLTTEAAGAVVSKSMATSESVAPKIVSADEDDLRAAVDGSVDMTPTSRVVVTTVPIESSPGTLFEAAEQMSSSASTHGRGEGLSAGIDRIGSVSAANENRPSRADDERAAALLRRLLVHHLLGWLIAARHGAQELFYELLRQIIAGITRTTIWVRQECIGIIRAARAGALRTVAQVHDRLRSITLLPTKRRRQRRSIKKRKWKKGARKPPARRGSKRRRSSVDGSCDD